MTRPTALLLLLGAAAVPLWADAPPAPPALSFTLTPTYVSQYMFRGARLGGSSFEPSLEGDYGNLAAGVWCNFPLADKVPGQSDPEVDPYATYTFALSDQLSLQPGLEVYTYPRAKTSDGFFRATVEPNLGLNATLGPVKVAPKVYYDLVLRSPTWELNASSAVPLKSAGTELDFLGTVGTYSARNWINTAGQGGPKTKAWGSYWLLGVTVPYQLAASVRLAVGYAYTRGFNASTQLGQDPKESSAPVGRGVLTVSLACTF